MENKKGKKLEEHAKYEGGELLYMGRREGQRLLHSVEE